MKITANGKELSLEGALPMTLGDLRKLKGLGVALERLTTGDPELLHALLLYLFKKGGAQITAEDIDAISVAQVGALSDYIASHSAGAVDRPT